MWWKKKQPGIKAYVDYKGEFCGRLIDALGMDADMEGVMSVQFNLGVKEFAKVTIERFMSEKETDIIIGLLKDFDIGDKMQIAEQIESLQGEVRMENLLRQHAEVAEVLAVEAQEEMERVFLGIPEPSDA